MARPEDRVLEEAAEVDADPEVADEEEEAADHQSLEEIGDDQLLPKGLSTGPESSTSWV